jgi:hypothetical protein
MNISKFLNSLTERLNGYKKEIGLTYFDNYTVIATEGKKYFKVYSYEVIGNSKTNSEIIAFIDKTTGDIYKPATHAAPAKHVRGNVNSPENGMEAIDEAGFVNYLK